ncbi:WD repeat-containing protein 78 [Orussus abietinus]|uniref:WD repeat-containing protein 78 n=1 Tax=Orussus abietinus TaxID=222816 RepID=UPI0006264B66|nr:WD repeat-containing protein 78 [Orussus abietinus]
MRPSGSDSPQKLGSRGQSTSSSRIKLNASGKVRRAIPKNVTSIVQQRQHLRVFDNGVDVTPKTLVHNVFGSIEERQLTAFDAIGLCQGGSNTQVVVSASGLKASSSMILFRSASVHTSILPTDDTPIESFASTQGIDSVQAIDDVPSEFYLCRYDSSISYIKPEKVVITLMETDTFFIFEMPQLTKIADTPEGQAVKEENERYEYITVGGGSNRKLATVETQTQIVHTKTRSTYLSRSRRKNQGTFVNAWVMYDSNETDGFTSGGYRESQNQENRFKLPKIEGTSEVVNPEDQLAQIYESIRFQDAIRVVERIIASNLYINSQKCFKGLIKQDPCSLDLEFTYSLRLLWTHSCAASQGRPVSCFRWSYINENLLAAGYGEIPGAEVKNGVVLIWCIKNPSQPDRSYTFNCPVSALDWSKDRPNFLAVGFYDGIIMVIDVSNKALSIMRCSQRITSPSYSPHWQVQWWAGEEQFDFKEQIYTSNQDGRILRYRSGEDFTSTEIMRISRIEGTVTGVNRTNHCTVYDIPISRNPGALVLRRYPNSTSLYFVGSDEGCIHRCSTNYLQQHIDSFLAHDGPVYSIEFSPFCSKIFLTCGADWCTRIWADGIVEPLITLSSTMACVHDATWCPTNSTIIASVVNNEICLWDIKRKIYKPTSITVSPHSGRFLSVQFTPNGNQLLAADIEGAIHVYTLEGMPFPSLIQTQLLVTSIQKALVTRPVLLNKLRKLGPPFI